MSLVVGISDLKVTADPSVTMITYSLGSCIGLAVYDPVVRVGGMLHYQLPTGTLDAERARRNPAMFGDSGMAELLRQMTAMGAQPGRFKTTVAGAAQMLNDGGIFNIGKRNHAAVRKLLWQHGILIELEDVGGSLPRNLYLSMADGQASIKVCRPVAVAG